MSGQVASLATSLLTLVCLIGCTHGAYTFVELSHVQNPSTIYWPGFPGFSRSVITKGENEEGVWIEAGAFSSGEHGGTHIDAPRHFVPDGLDLSEFPLERTVAEGVKVDLSAEADKDYDFAVSVANLEKWEEENGRIPNDAAVLFYFGYAPKFSDPSAYFNADDTSTPDNFHFPYVSIEAAQWLVDNRNLKMIGLDVASPDQPQDSTFPVHVLLLNRDIMIMENVNIPLSLPPRDFRVHAAPIRVENGTGVQTRIYAMLYDSVSDSAGRAGSHWSPLSLWLLATITAVTRSILG